MYIANFPYFEADYRNTKMVIFSMVISALGLIIYISPGGHYEFYDLICITYAKTCIYY